MALGSSSMYNSQSLKDSKHYDSTKENRVKSTSQDFYDDKNQQIELIAYPPKLIDTKGEIYHSSKEEMVQENTYSFSNEMAPNTKRNNEKTIDMYGFSDVVIKSNTT